MLTHGLLPLVVAGILIFASSSIAIAQSADRTPVKLLGSFWNVKSDGEHAVGHSVDLWKHGSEIVGLVSVHAGLVGDPPTGKIDNVKFDPATKRLNFTAKLTTGMFFDKTHDNVPSQDVLKFTGHLYAKTLRGVISVRNKLCEGKCVEKTKVNLPLNKARTRDIGSFANLAAWDAYAAPILEMLGPKW